MENCIGKICPFCKTEIKEEDDVKVCPVCNTTHHADCWEKNKGCATFGCSEQHCATQHVDSSGVCQNCGAKIQEGQAFCRKCGQKIEPDTDMRQPNNQKEDPVIYKNRKKKTVNIIISIVAVVVVFLIVFSIVVAFGKHTYTMVEYLSAGGSHTVGLKSDGTVVAVGYNGSGQCEVNSWSDITAVSASGNHTIG